MGRILVLPDFHPYENYRNFWQKNQWGGSILTKHIMVSHYLLGKFKKVSAFNSKISSLDKSR